MNRIACWHRLLAVPAVLAPCALLAQAPPEPWVREIGSPQYFAVFVEDVDWSVTWYRTALGLDELGGSAAEDGSWRIENLGNKQLLVELIRDDRAQVVDRARGFRKVGFRVPDVETVADRVARATGERPRVVDFPRFGLRIIQIRDPDGNIIQLSSLLEPATRGG
jgi:predicted enzyme related to lactoylglutathione lyase